MRHSRSLSAKTYNGPLMSTRRRTNNNNACPRVYISRPLLHLLFSHITIQNHRSYLTDKMVVRTRSLTPSAKSPRAQASVGSGRHSSMGRYSREWISIAQSTDPIFGKPKALASLEKLLGIHIQPFTHSPNKLFPNVAAKFGLQRHIPGKGLPKGARGPKCVVNGKKSMCHKPCLPAWLYT